ncbi:glycosyltransferase [Lactiplantibacillus plantarum]|jgi:rhamnosyltransferase|uniref:glycosyltransferase n=1 Tax=Lactiplantibacillus plantarum TaxID=1590 RepID=UPI0009323AE4|nr:glycosyltransferase [Lactiplantibacillus plantarum]AUS73576.1 UDP-Glc:alpha-D-GlcNAc-diphosphoundecaprenol beta-1,3-glucosyltransferase WfgD [Lactiplantibacillus plantarum]USZ13234.1 glycosyltransferase [Lactiplantibacillus plantarum]UVE91522.1 glycosyltransferase [Lactiplantibacillus plantarum]
MKKIVILMATYNGEKYIEKQIVSIMQQTYSNWELIIQDDGSVDNTKKIIDGFVKKDARIHLTDNLTDFHGAYENFYTLIKRLQSNEFKIDFDYIALSDQDDIWEQDRLAFETQKLNKMCTIPCLVYSDYRVIDGMGKVVLASANAGIGLVPKPKEALFFANAYVWGNTVMFNKLLLDVLVISNDVLASKHPHDAYLAKVATIVGSIEYIDRILVNYRRFSGNVSSTMWYKLSIVGVLKKANLLKRAETLGVTLDQGLLVIHQYGSVKQYELKLAMLKGGLTGIKYLLKHRIRRQQVLRTISIYIVLATGWYKKWLKG